ncbi:unnamed protein product [Moneuplotes crassus]|uniref:Uncharacterized protein n=1 Tax=Euplotes crassus TaxID=5936 RepID=A0AAD1UE33_EUPCR|nr:unnamed protein product [Moneuplotes crassus]
MSSKDIQIVQISTKPEKSQEGMGVCPVCARIPGKLKCPECSIPYCKHHLAKIIMTSPGGFCKNFKCKKQITRESYLKMAAKLQNEVEDVDEIKDHNYDESDEGSFMNSDMVLEDSGKKKESISSKEFKKYLDHKMKKYKRFTKKELGSSIIVEDLCESVLANESSMFRPLREVYNEEDEAEGESEEEKKETEPKPESESEGQKKTSLLKPESEKIKKEKQSDKKKLGEKAINLGKNVLKQELEQERLNLKPESKEKGLDQIKEKEKLEQEKREQEVLGNIEEAESEQINDSQLEPSEESIKNMKISKEEVQENEKYQKEIIPAKGQFDNIGDDQNLNNSHKNRDSEASIEVRMEPEKEENQPSKDQSVKNKDKKPYQYKEDEQHKNDVKNEQDGEGDKPNGFGNGPDHNGNPSNLDEGMQEMSELCAAHCYGIMA